MSTRGPHDTAVRCEVCPHGCVLVPGNVGRCRARAIEDGRVVPRSYGRITSMALDPVEKKPLAHWMSGHYLLSVGSYGCNLRCLFCQNHSIAQAGEGEVPWRYVSPQDLVDLTLETKVRNPQTVGIAHTYNEPLVAWEYVRDVGALAHEAGLANVLVSNGCAQPWVIDALAPLVDAANIDLKGFSDEYYRWCGGSFSTVKACIERLAAEAGCHLEVTCLAVPHRNDTPHEMRALSGWLASVDPAITLHVTRYFPRWKMVGDMPTPVDTVYHLADVAREALAHVVVGNC